MVKIRTFLPWVKTWIVCVCLKREGGRDYFSISEWNAIITNQLVPGDWALFLNGIKNRKSGNKNMTN